MVMRIATALDEPRALRSIDEPNGAVMAEREILGELSDRRSIGTSMTFDGE